MRAQLTRTLQKMTMVVALLGLTAPVMADVSALQSQEQKQYLEGLKRLYLTQDERKALLAHSNALLNTYALRAGYQVGQGSREDLTYSLSLGGSGELIVREQSRSADDALAVSNRKLSVFGLDPFIRYECPTPGIRCVILVPGQSAPLLTIVRDHDGAEQLAKALSYLIRNVQRG